MHSFKKDSGYIEQTLSEKYRDRMLNFFIKLTAISSAKDPLRESFAAWRAPSLLCDIPVWMDSRIAGRKVVKMIEKAP